MPMDDAVVFSGNSFIGFELCRAFLEEGMTVLGLDEGDLDEDRLLEIGRNANFQYQKCDQIQRPEHIPSPSYLVFSFYDDYYQRKEGAWKAIKPVIEKGLDWKKHHFIFLYPTIWLIKEEKHSLFKEAEELRKQAEKEKAPVSVFYLPTIFGPRQPASFLFSKAISDPSFQWENSCIDEDLADALYVEDAVHIINIQKKRPNTFVLVNVHPSSWEEIISLVIQDEEQKKALKKLCKDRSRNTYPFETLKVENQLSLAEALQKQIIHIKKQEIHDTPFFKF
jgi:nucleoside-diphosphate-sugar epimerase